VLIRASFRGSNPVANVCVEHTFDAATGDAGRHVLRNTHKELTECITFPMVEAVFAV
jgi:hypothetical protein